MINTQELLNESTPEYRVFVETCNQVMHTALNFIVGETRIVNISIPEEIRTTYLLAYLKLVSELSQLAGVIFNYEDVRGFKANMDYMFVFSKSGTTWEVQIPFKLSINTRS
jgi:hypothetical protein